MTKDYYINQIKKIGQYLIDKADYILLDFDTDRIREINIKTSLQPRGIPIVEVSKEYLPLPIENIMVEDSDYYKNYEGEKTND